MAIPRVVLVDDQRQVTRMLRTSLELSGRAYDIVDVRSAEEALGEMDRGPVDLVVTDLRLPEMSGLELIARIRQTHPGMRLPDACDQLQTGHLRQSQIRDDQVDRAAIHFAQRLFGGPDVDDVVRPPGEFQAGAQHACYLALVIDQEHPRGGHGGILAWGD